MKKSIAHSLIFALAAGLGFTSVTACDAPEEVDEPGIEIEEGATELGEPSEAPEAPEAPEMPEQIEAPAIDGPDGAPEAPSMGAHPMGDRDFTTDDVDKFAEVIESLQELDENREDPRARMEAAESPQERQAIQQELIGEMNSAIADAGMNFQEFMMMAQAVQTDPELRERLEERVDMEEIMGGGPADGPAEGQEAPPVMPE